MSPSSVPSAGRPPRSLHGEGARRGHRPLRPAVPAVEARHDEEVPDHHPHLSGPAGRHRSSSGDSDRRASSASLAELGFVVVQVERTWGRPGAPRRSTTSTTATWATTASPTTSRRSSSSPRGTASSTSTGSASTDSRAAASPPPTRSSAIPTSSRWRSRRRGTTTTGRTTSSGARSTRAC